MGLFDFLSGGEKKEVAAPEKKGPKLGKSGKKICCSCPDTKQLRDECVVNNGEQSCADVIEAHKLCLRAEGFTVK
jgi:cytochrome c oxidase assembly protein subunit 17